MKKKHKKRKKKKSYYPVFAPLYPGRLGTPKTSYTSKDTNPNPAPSPNPPGPSNPPSGGGGGGAPMGAAGGGGGGAMGSSIIPPSRKKIIHEIRKVLGSLSEGDTASTHDPAWLGYSAPSPAVVMRQGGPQPSGAGFQPVPPGQSGRYDFQRSPGLGFKTEKAWRVWEAIVDILGKRPTLPVHAVMQAAMARAGAKFGDIDPAEMRLLQMGYEWYMSDPNKMRPKDSDGGGNTGFGATQLNPVTY